MRVKPTAMVVDDGELTDVRAFLDEFGAEYVHLQGNEIPEEVENPDRLFVTTARRAVKLQYQGGAQRRPKRPVRIAVASGTSKSQRSALKRAGFDFLVHRPVHPTAFRLLLLHALYGGQERRQATRFPFGYEVTYRTGLWRRKATLAELSAEGCRLIASQRVNPDTQISVQLPREVAGGKALTLPGCVIRSRKSARGEAIPAEWWIGVRFRKLDDETRARLRAVLVERYWGPAMLPGKPTLLPPKPAPPPEAPHEEPADKLLETDATSPDAEQGPERRKQLRVAYGADVVALSEDAARVLVGRDLSREGMRVDPHTSLKIGDELRVAIYANVQGEPIVLNASVVRDDGDDGFVLRFQGADPSDEDTLEELMEAFSSIESISGIDAPTLILSEVVGAESRADQPPSD